MSVYKKLIILVTVISVCFCMAMLKIYNQSKSYFEYAESQYKQKHYIEALKGMNKLEMRREEQYLGGYQQVLESWENAIGGFKPDFYQTAQKRIDETLVAMNSDELLKFIEIYVELDIRYVPEATSLLINLSDDEELVLEMDAFLKEAFPLYVHDENILDNQRRSSIALVQGL